MKQKVDSCFSDKYRLFLRAALSEIAAVVVPRICSRQDEEGVEVKREGGSRYIPPLSDVSQKR